MFSFLRKQKANAKPTVRAKNAVKSRTVVHQRWIHTDELKRGMYVAELSVAWDETDFMFQGFELNSDKVIEQVRDVAQYALVKTQKVSRLSPNNNRHTCSA